MEEFQQTVFHSVTPLRMFRRSGSGFADKAHAPLGET
jgi:hypothetical protein